MIIGTTSLSATKDEYRKSRSVEFQLTVYVGQFACLHNSSLSLSVHLQTVQQRGDVDAIHGSQPAPGSFAVAIPRGTTGTGQTLRPIHNHKFVQTKQPGKGGIGEGAQRNVEYNVLCTGAGRVNKWLRRTCASDHSRS